MNAHFDPTHGSALRLPQPYLLFLADTVDAGFAKTAFGLRDWAGDKCVGEFALGATVSTGLPVMTPAEARAAGARALVIGVANSGGVIGDSWIASLVEALEAGLDIVSGMHARLSEMPELVEAAARLGRRLIDVRVPPSGLRDRHRRQAFGQAAADRRHRLRAGQEIHRARARERLCRARASMSISARPARPAS